MVIDFENNKSYSVKLILNSNYEYMVAEFKDGIVIEESMEIVQCEEEAQEIFSDMAFEMDCRLN